jgi:hypothetical protein
MPVPGPEPRLDSDSASVLVRIRMFFFTLALGPVGSPDRESNAGFSANPVPHPEPDTGPIWIRILCLVCASPDPDVFLTLALGPV